MKIYIIYIRVTASMCGHVCARVHPCVCIRDRYTPYTRITDIRNVSMVKNERGQMF